MHRSWLSNMGGSIFQVHTHGMSWGVKEGILRGTGAAGRIPHPSLIQHPHPAATPVTQSPVSHGCSPSHQRRRMCVARGNVQMVHHQNHAAHVPRQSCCLGDDDHPHASTHDRTKTLKPTLSQGFRSFLTQCALQAAHGPTGHHALPAGPPATAQAGGPQRLAGGAGQRAGGEAGEP